MIRTLSGIFLIFIFCAVSAARAADVSAVLAIDGEKSAEIVFDFKISDGEHIYSAEPSENGSPTRISITPPDGWRLDSLEFPEPRGFEYFGIKSKGYSGDFKVYAKLSATKGKTAKEKLRATVEMLACSDVCVPIKKTFEFDLPSTTPAARSSALWYALFAAFLGGAILNLMPCVFPVIGLKIASFARQSQGLGGRLAGAAAYSAGIIISFLALGGVLAVLRGAGAELGWGFQLQNPIFAAAMALLFFAMGLSFAGVFEIGAGFAGGFAVGGKNKYVSAAMSGVLAVLVASPCTAPFMGTAVGAALAAEISAWASLSIFAALGLGMATPYVLLALCADPKKFLPKAGAWTEILKQILSLPLFASAIWLAWVYCNQTQSPARIMAAALVLAVGLRIYGLYSLPHFSRKIRAAANIGCIGAAAAAVWIAADTPPFSPEPDKIATAENAWSEEKLGRLRAQGHAVYVDFTASWCLTCQYNKTVLESEKIKKLFADKKIKMLVGDWTNKNADIARELGKFGRAGVPLNLLYPAESGKPPIVLPAVLTQSAVIEAVDKAAR